MAAVNPCDLRLIQTARVDARRRRSKILLPAVQITRFDASTRIDARSVSAKYVLHVFELGVYVRQSE
jgi:hypothetical protein